MSKYTFLVPGARTGRGLLDVRRARTGRGLLDVRRARTGNGALFLTYLRAQ